MGLRYGMAVLGLLVAGTGCAKQSAESAIDAAEKMVAGLGPQAEQLAPVELKVINDSIAAMKARVASGDYSGALMGARQTTSIARDLSAALVNRKTQLTSSFTALTAELPKQMEAVVGKINQLAAMKKLPKGVDPARVAALKTEAAGWAATWTAATEAFKAGNLADAVAKGNDLKTKVAKVAAMFGG